MKHNYLILIIYISINLSKLFDPRWSSGYDFRLSFGKARETGVRFPVEEFLFSLIYCFFVFIFSI